MQRIYLPNIQFSESITLSDLDILHQLTKVLRCREGDEVIFFDGKIQQDHVYVIIQIDKKQLQFRKKGIISKSSELNFAMTLYQAIPNKLSKLEYIVQKCSEVGFCKIVFFPSERSQKLILSDNRKQRLRSIMTEAVEQCGRNNLCELIFQETFYSQGGDDIGIVFHQELGSSSKQIKDISIKTGQSVGIYVGPEGGFSEEEVSQFEENDFQRVYLGERILRCETAGAVTGFFLGQNS